MEAASGEGQGTLLGQCQDTDQAEPVRGGALTSVARGSQTRAPTSLFPDLRFGDLPEATDPGPVVDTEHQNVLSAV